MFIKILKVLTINYQKVSIITLGIKDYKKVGNIREMILELKSTLNLDRLDLYMTPIVPLAYIKMCKPKLKRHGPNKYTVEGRSYIHKNQQSVPEWKLQWLRKNPVINQRASIEYNDNRIALYIAQKGKCAVSDGEMFLDEIHCHHKHYWSKKI